MASPLTLPCTTDRRQFVQRLFLIGSMVALSPAAVWAVRKPTDEEASSAGTSSAAPSAPALGHEVFAKLRGTTFTAPGGALLTLASVSALQKDASTESFSLWLESASGDVPDGCRCFSHPKLGAFDLFVVAKTLPDGRRGCEAVFNRIV